MKHHVRLLCVYIVAALMSQQLSPKKCNIICDLKETCVGSICDDKINTRCCPPKYIGPRSYFRARSQGDNTARRLVGWQDIINCPGGTTTAQYKFDDGGVVGAYAATFEYQRSFKSDHIAKYLFGSNRLSFKGSQVPGRDNSRDIVADYFGLPTDFIGTLIINPVIDNFILDNQLYLALDSFLCGLFFRVDIPVVHSRWDLRLVDCTEISNNPPTLFPAGYMGIVTNQLTPQGQQVDPVTTGIQPLKSLREGLSGQTFGQMSTPWRFGKFPWCRKELTRIADITFNLGFNIWDSPFSSFGFYGVMVAPAGNRPDPRFIFTPVIGTGHHWQLGAGIRGYVGLMDSGYYSAGIYYEGNVTHLFNSDHIRSFDFTCNGRFSRYLLLKQIGKPVLLNNNVADLVIQDTAAGVPAFQEFYAGNLINAINFTTRIAEVNVPVKGDFSIKLALDAGPYSFDIGYNIYGHSRENVCIKCLPPCSTDIRQYAIKGTTGTHFFAGCNEAIYGNSAAVTLNASQSCATLYNGTINPRAVDNARELITIGDQSVNLVGTVSAIDPATGQVINSIVDLQPCPNNVSRIGINWNADLNADEIINRAELERTNTIAFISNPPVLVRPEDLNISSATAPAQLTHKVFTHVNYIWRYSRFTPFIGLGAEIEFADKRCPAAGLNQWGIMLKGGITF